MNWIDAVRSLSAYRRLLSDLAEGSVPDGLALMRSARLPILSALYKDLNCPILLITHRGDHAMSLFDELGFWSPGINRKLFPEPNPLFYEQTSWGNVTRGDRLQALTALAEYHQTGTNNKNSSLLLVAPIRAVMTRTLPRRDFLKSVHSIKIGDNTQPAALLRKWLGIGYEPADTVLEPGQFSHRGGIMDIWPLAESNPVRIEFFGNDIETIRQFDPASQRTLEKMERLLVTPAREVLPSSAERILPADNEIDEFYIPIVHPAHASILDYLPSQAMVVFDDLDTARASAEEIEQQAVKARKDAVGEGSLSTDFPLPYLPWSELEDNLDSHRWMDLGRSSGLENHPLADVFTPGPRFAGRLKPLIDDLVMKAASGEWNQIVSRQAPRLIDLWRERQDAADLPIQPTFEEGSLSEGWSLQLDDGSRLNFLTDSEVFGWERSQPRLRRQTSADAPESGYADLKPGDWVVHMDYGIGRLVGLVERTVERSAREYLLVEYDGGDQLYVPVHQADRLNRFIGPDGQAPSLTRLGSAEWTLAKQRVRSAVEEIAHDLLDLYAQRQIAKGHQFRSDSPWQKELEASFPFVETPDQLKAINEVKLDMENERPMDRLLCGDVGYGKTEVALRSAFKAVMDGKQVGMLVPTTVLAQQHYETFRDRLVAFPVIIEMLSRFRSPREQDEIVKKLKNGSIDILIGTHRLLQTDVQFKDLGLVIIDEEQRFGVTHKEHLKKLRTEVDVLTLTATPIPRTLYMALTGVRDISSINTPPEERLPIVTHIGPYSPQLVRQAVLRELERGGQIFFVHNRVQTIFGMRAHLKQILPEAKVGVAHGQMPENDLSSVMHRFTRGEIDILLCTSIIESGLDIPNVNTLIVDRGDTFGLAQLYQLRGRVGRGANRAYAYFFRHRKKTPTIEGQERLEVIAENTQLGSGYSIAMRDLEMRGAGELLGIRQHGYIASVGFHLYTRLLSQSVRTIREGKGLPITLDTQPGFRQIRFPVSVDLPISVGIPVDYVPDQNMRLRLYRRLADLESEEDIKPMQEEFTDRFGPPPLAMRNLFFQLQLKLRAEAAGLSSISVEGEQIVLRFPSLPEGVGMRNLPELGGQIRSGKNAYWMPMPPEPEVWRPALLASLTEIARNCQPF